MNWINLGREMALVDASGRLTGRLIPLDEQISRKISESFYEASRRSEIDAKIFSHNRGSHIA
ncbi:hypothetical protein D3C72_1252090 [compost metagenome]